MKKLLIVLLAVLFYFPAYAQVVDQATLTQQLVEALQQTITLLISEVQQLQLQLGQALARQQTQDLSIQNIQTTQQVQSNQIQQIQNQVAPTPLPVQSPTPVIQISQSVSTSTPVIQPYKLVVDVFCGIEWSFQAKPCNNTVTKGTSVLNSILYRPYLLDKDGEFQSDFTSIPITVTFPESDKVKTEYVYGAYPGIDGNQYVYTPTATGTETVTFSANGFTVTKTLTIKDTQ